MKQLQIIPLCFAVTVWLLSACAPDSCLAHNEIVHIAITSSAYFESFDLFVYLRDNIAGYHASLADVEYYTTHPLLLGHPVPYTSGQSYSPYDWLRWGSYWEDMTLYADLHLQLRVPNHFYTLRPQMIAGRVLPLTDKSETFRFLPDSLNNSFDWATQAGILGPVSATIGSVGPNTETWQDARNYQYASLTSPSQVVRDENLAHMLYALGHVLHLNQDLSSPDHVRNDNHFFPWHRFIENYGKNIYLKNAKASSTAYSQLFPNNILTDWYHSWRPIGFQKLEDFWDRKLYKGKAKELNDDATAQPGAALGLAEFTNGNFLGDDAKYGEIVNPLGNQYFPLPSLLTSTDFAQVKNKVIANIDHVAYPDGTIGTTIYLRKVADGVHFDHHSKLTFLGVQLAKKNGAKLVVNTSIDDPNVLEDYHRLLIPRAILYSGGILNYYFRGRMSVDAAWDNALGKCRLTIHNVSGQAMKGGTFALYYDSASGNRAPVNDFTSAYTASLADQGTFEATFTPPGGSVTRYTLVYSGGTIGLSGSTALDLVDQNFAHCAQSFVLVWYEILANDPQADLYFDATHFGIVQDHQQPGPLHSGDKWMSISTESRSGGYGFFNGCPGVFNLTVFSYDPPLNNYTIDCTLKTYFNSSSPITINDFSLTPLDYSFDRNPINIDYNYIITP